MTKDEMAAKIAATQAWVPGKRIKLDFGDDGIVMMDGVAQAVTEEDGAADTTIKINWTDWEALAAGTLNPMTAFMSGKIRVEGDMSGAMQLQGALSRLAD